MRNSRIYLLYAGLVIMSAFAGCTQQKQKAKITDIPVTSQSKEALASFKQGLQLFDQGDGVKARTLFMKAIEQDPKMGIAYLFKSNSDVSNQEFADDIKNAKANIDSASKWEKWYCDYYGTFLTGDVKKRLEITTTMADSFPDAARAQVDLGFTYQAENDATHSRECFQKAVSLDSNWVGGYAALTNSYLFIDPKDYKTAEANALKTVALAPSSPGAEIALGDCYRAENDLQKARDAYSKATDLDPSTPESYYKKGHANTFLGNYDEARQNYMDAGKHDITKVPSTQFIAYTYLYAGDTKTAAKSLMDAAAKADASGESKDKINTDKLAYLGDCERIAMHTNDADMLKKLMTEIMPLNAEGATAIGTQEAKTNDQANNLYWQSILAAMQGHYDDAKASAEQMKTVLDPINDPNKLVPYHFALGYIAMKQKNYGDAVSHFQETNPSLLMYNNYWLAMANEGAGNKDKANALYKEISQYNFNGVDYALVRNEAMKKMTK